MPIDSQAAQWTVERLRRTVRRLVSEGIVEAALLDRARPQLGDDRLIRLVAGIKAAAPDRTLQQIAAQLEAMRERTPRGGTRWHPSSVKHLLTRAVRIGLDTMSGIQAQNSPRKWKSLLSSQGEVTCGPWLGGRLGRNLPG